jgi:hypothetical protein
MLPLALVLRRRPPELALPGPSIRGAHPSAQPLGFMPGALQAILCVAGLACGVAMSMPQVHIVAYCGDLGFGPARGAEMLSLMLGCGIVSRLASGWICDHIGGLRTLLLGSLLQGVALALSYSSTNSSRSTSSRRSSACFRAGSSRRTQSSSANISRPARRGLASASY